MKDLLRILTIILLSAGSAQGDYLINLGHGNILRWDNYYEQYGEYCTRAEASKRQQCVPIERVRSIVPVGNGVTNDEKDYPIIYRLAILEYEAEDYETSLSDFRRVQDYQDSLYYQGLIMKKFADRESTQEMKLVRYSQSYGLFVRYLTANSHYTEDAMQYIFEFADLIPRFYISSINASESQLSGCLKASDVRCCNSIAAKTKALSDFYEAFSTSQKRLHEINDKMPAADSDVARRLATLNNDIGNTKRKIDRRIEAQRKQEEDKKRQEYEAKMRERQMLAEKAAREKEERAAREKAEVAREKAEVAREKAEDERRKEEERKKRLASFASTYEAQCETHSKLSDRDIKDDIIKDRMISISDGDSDGRLSVGRTININAFTVTKCEGNRNGDRVSGEYNAKFEVLKDFGSYTRGQILYVEGFFRYKKTLFGWDHDPAYVIVLHFDQYPTARPSGSEQWDALKSDVSKIKNEFKEGFKQGWERRN